MNKRKIERQLKKCEHKFMKLKMIGIDLEEKYNYINEIPIQHKYAREEKIQIKKEKIKQLEKELEGKDLDKIEYLLCYCEYLFNELQTECEERNEEYLDMVKDLLQDIISELNRILF